MERNDSKNNFQTNLGHDDLMPVTSNPLIVWIIKEITSFKLVFFFLKNLSNSKTKNGEILKRQAANRCESDARIPRRDEPWNLLER